MCKPVRNARSNRPNERRKEEWNSRYKSARRRGVRNAASSLSILAVRSTVYGIRYTVHSPRSAFAFALMCKHNRVGDSRISVSTFLVPHSRVLGACFDARKIRRIASAIFFTSLSFVVFI